MRVWPLASVIGGGGGGGLGGLGGQDDLGGRNDLGGRKDLGLGSHVGDYLGHYAQESDLAIVGDNIGAGEPNQMRELCAEKGNIQST